MSINYYKLENQNKNITLCKFFALIDQVIFII